MRARLSPTARLVFLGAAASVVSAVLVALPSTASARAIQPADLRIVRVTGTSFTMTVGDVPTNATSFRLYASTVEADVWWSNLDARRHSRHLHWATSSSPTITIGGLSYSADPWFVRMEAMNSAEHSYSPNVWRIGLRPKAPTGLHVHASSHGTFLTWNGVQASGFDVQQATDRQMRHGVGVFGIRSRSSAAHEFTPGGAAVFGHRYYWRVRAWNSGTISGWTAVVSARVLSHLTPVRVMTYNLLARSFDGDRWGCGIRVAPWSSRRGQAVKVVRSYVPDVLALQEGGQRNGTGPTQGEDFVRALGGYYRLADTDNKTQHIGNYIAYNSGRVRPVNAGGHWLLGSHGVDGTYDAVYQEFESRAHPGARFLFVNTHLPPISGHFADVLRYHETSYIISKARKLAAKHGIKVVYAGDYNSFPSQTWHSFDGPQVAMRNADIANAESVAAFRWNSNYASINRYCMTPSLDGVHLDYIWVQPGIVASSWGIVVRLDSRGLLTWPIPSDHNPVAGMVKLPY